MDMNSHLRSIYHIYVESFCSTISEHLENYPEHAIFLLKNITNMDHQTRTQSVMEKDSTLKELITSMHDMHGNSIVTIGSKAYKKIYDALFALRHNVYLNKKEPQKDRKLVCFTDKIHADLPIQQIQEYCEYVIDHFCKKLEKKYHENELKHPTYQVKIELLYKAARNGNSDKVENILKHYKKILNAPYENGETALHAAVISGNRETIEVLLKHNVDVNSDDGDGMTALFYAVELGHDDIAEQLLEHNARVNKKNNAGYTPLHFAVLTGHSEMIDVLINYGANLDTPNNNGLTPLHTAVKEEDYETIEVLVNRDVATNCHDASGLTPLHIAAISGNQEIIDCLIENGADLCAKDDMGNTFSNYLNNNEENRA